MYFWQEMFDERPVWTKAALTYGAVGVEKNAMRFILASTAYYFTTGPWRNAWVRIGYDPRLDPNSRYMLIRCFQFKLYETFQIIVFVFWHNRNYQILDYRISQNFRNKVIPKRSYSKYNQPHKYASAMRTKTSTIRQPVESTTSTTTASDKKGENSYIYRPGMIPQCRQMFYQVLYNYLSYLASYLLNANFSIAISMFLKFASFWLLRQ